MAEGCYSPGMLLAAKARYKKYVYPPLWHPSPKNYPPPQSIILGDSIILLFSKICKPLPIPQNDKRRTLSFSCVFQYVFFKPASHALPSSASDPRVVSTDFFYPDSLTNSISLFLPRLTHKLHFLVVFSSFCFVASVLVQRGASTFVSANSSFVASSSFL